MKKIFRILGIALLVAVFGGTIYFLYTKSKKQPDVFETKTPFVSNVIRKTVATGSVVPRQEIEIKTMERLFKEARRVANIFRD